MSFTPSSYPSIRRASTELGKNMTLESDRPGFEFQQSHHQASDLGTLKNFLGLGVVFYKTKRILSTIQDWWDIKYITES